MIHNDDQRDELTYMCIYDGCERRFGDILVDIKNLHRSNMFFVY
jgi:hypothetical protein